MNGNNPADQFMLALCAWRENRHGQRPGMQSVINCIMNRVNKSHTSPYFEITKFEQFSSITAPKDLQLSLYPIRSDSQWLLAQELTDQALANNLPDITGGALSYYAVSIEKVPWWAPSMTPTIIIAGQQFLK